MKACNKLQHGIKVICNVAKPIEVQLQLDTFDINLNVPSMQHIQWKLHTAKISVFSHDYIQVQFLTS